MTMNLHTQTTAPKASQATSVSPLEQSGSSKTKFSRGKSKARAGAVKTDLYQTVTDSIIAALEPLSSILLAFAVFGQDFGSFELLGMALIIAAVGVVSVHQ